MDLDSSLPDAPYVYQPLDSINEIRLIHVRRHENGAIHCDLTTSSLQARPNYVCLSYQWGPPSSTKRIVINDGYFEVRDNLFNFLNEYCDEPHSHIWIDQISIDQSNIHERNQQVGLMTKIYRQAVYVVLWLGNDRSTIEAASTLVRTGIEARYRSMVIILRNSYFTRLWVVQEILLAKEVRLMVRHNLWVRWGDMSYIVHVKRDSAWPDVPQTAISLFLHREIPKPYELESCIERFSGQACEDLRDRVYGLLGLVSNRVYPIPVDYEKSIQEVFFDAVKALCLRYLKNGISVDRQPAPGFLVVNPARTDLFFNYDDEHSSHIEQPAQYGATLRFWNPMRTLSKNLGLSKAEEKIVQCFLTDVCKFGRSNHPDVPNISMGFETAKAQNESGTPGTQADSHLKDRWWFEYKGHRRYYY